MCVFNLSAELVGHENDVRQVVALPQNGLVSVSRDSTIRVWHLDSKKWENVKTMTEHQQTADGGGVASVHVIPQGHPVWKEGIMATGGYDKMIVLWDLSDYSAQCYLQGHQGAVLCINHLENGYLLSGSSDNSIIVWKNAAVHKTLYGHEHPVWAVLGLPNLDIVSGSGDQTVRIWRQYQCIRTIKDHLESVRYLCELPGVGFLSTSNDGVIKMRSIEGKPLSELVGHGDSVYSAAVLQNGEEVASASEDGTLRVWRGSKCEQVLYAPSGIWSVAALKNGDLAIGCQDHTIRVWTRDESRMQPESERKAYEERVERWRSSKKEREQGKPKIGGVEYDHVFNVETEEGQKLKLGYNNRDDPVDAAQKFIQEYGLLPSMLDQVVQFIEKATGRSSGTPVEQSKTSESKRMSSTHFPASNPILFGDGNFERIYTKVNQFNEELKNSENHRSLCITEDELERIDSLFKLLKETRSYHISQIDQGDVDLVFSILDRWPREKRFPVLDLIRLGMIHSEFAKKSIQYLPKIAEELAVDSHHSNQIMALRCYLNAFKSASLRETMIQMADHLLQVIEPFLESKNENVSTLASILLVNYSIVLAPLNSDSRIIIILMAIHRLLMRPETSNTNVYHSIVVLGTLLSADPSLKKFVLESEKQLIEHLCKRIESGERLTHSAARDLHTILTEEC